jgi:hypothetical protein
MQQLDRFEAKEDSHSKEQQIYKPQSVHVDGSHLRGMGHDDILDIRLDYEWKHSQRDDAVDSKWNCFYYFPYGYPQVENLPNQIVCLS